MSEALEHVEGARQRGGRPIGARRVVFGCIEQMFRHNERDGSITMSA
jgi:hypothetical protein